MFVASMPGRHLVQKTFEIPWPALNPVVDYGYFPRGGINPLTTAATATEQVYGQCLTSFGSMHRALMLKVDRTRSYAELRVGLVRVCCLGGWQRSVRISVPLTRDSAELLRPYTSRIGGESPQSLISSLVGAVDGFSGSHNTYASDTGPTRGGDLIPTDFQLVRQV